MIAAAGPAIVMPVFSVRTVIRWSPRADQKLAHLYEERITLWNAASLEAAINLAEQEAEKYADQTGELLGDLQGFWLFDDFAVPIQGCEVFSLLRESDLEPRQYLKAFFATGFERQQPYGAKADAASGVAPEASAGCSGASDGPPSAN